MNINLLQFINNSDDTDQEVSYKYTPDKLIALPSGLSFSRVLILIIISLSCVDFIIFGLPDGPIPYNYQFLFGIIYLLSAAIILEKMYDQYDLARRELNDISDRTSDALVTDLEKVELDKLNREYQSILDIGFHPVVLIGGGLIGGAFVFGIMFLLDVLWAYPHILSDYLYGAAHGLYYGPLAAGVYLVYKISNEYISNIDILAPDGVGGYREMGDALVSTVTYAIYLVTLDSIIISSVSFLDNPLFTKAAVVIYVAMLLFFLIFTLYAVLSIRRRLLDIQERKVDQMRKHFNEAERSFWKKKLNNKSASREAEEILTMYNMFDHLNQMELWPLNLFSFAKLGLSVASSLIVFAFNIGIVQL